MSISKKIFFSLLFSSVFIFILFSYATFNYDRYKYIEFTKEHLISVVNIQKNRINQFVDTTKEKTILISSNLELRDSLSSYLTTKDKKVLDKIKDVTENINYYSNIVKNIHLHDLDGNLIFSSDKYFIKANFDFTTSVEKLREVKVNNEILKNSNGEYLFRSRAPLFKDDKIIGVLCVDFDSSELNSITEDYTGLGKTGETVLAKATVDGAVFLTPLRFDANAALKRTLEISQDNVPMIKALKGQNSFFS